MKSDSQQGENCSLRDLHLTYLIAAEKLAKRFSVLCRWVE